MPNKLIWDVPPTGTQEQPTTPGFYKYAQGRSSLIFCLDTFGNWWAITDAPQMQRCVWAYIDQALSVETLVRI